MESWLDKRFVGDTNEVYASLAPLSDETRAGLLSHLRTVNGSLKPTPKEAIVIGLTRLAAHYWGDRTETQWKIVFEDYARDLEKFPADIVAEGINRYRRKGKFWPKVSELIEVMEPLLTKRLRAQMRLRKICNAPAETKTGIVPAMRRFPEEAA